MDAMVRSGAWARRGGKLKRAGGRPVNAKLPITLKVTERPRSRAPSREPLTALNGKGSIGSKKLGHKGRGSQTIYGRAPSMPIWGDDRWQKMAWETRERPGAVFPLGQQITWATTSFPAALGG
jgi:hypothetical protein